MLTETAEFPKALNMLTWGRVEHLRRYVGTMTDCPEFE